MLRYLARKDAKEDRQREEKVLAKGFYHIRVSNALRIAGEKDNVLSEAMTRYCEKYMYPRE